MKNKDAYFLLQQMILERERDHLAHGKLLKGEFQTAYKDLNPASFIVNGIKDAITTPQVKANLKNAAIGLGAGLLVKKVFTERTHNPVSKLFGLAMEIIVANLAAKHGDEIRATGSFVLKKILKKTSPSEEM